MTGEKKRFRFLKRKENGQATVEFALLCPLLLGILFGIIDFGWIFFNIAMVNNATRNCARKAIVRINDYAETVAGGEKETDPATKKVKFNQSAFETNLEAEIKDELPNYLKRTAANLKLKVKEENTVSSLKDDMIAVTVEADIPLFTPVLSTLVGNDHWKFNKTIKMRREY